MPTILVADDNRQLVEMLRATLEDEGFDVVTAYSGLTAASLVEREHVDLLVLDVLMPGMSGDAVAELLHQLKPELPVLLMTGDSGDLFAQTTGLPRLHKPFTQQELVQAVGELLSTS